jgi:hypothetical protein
MADSPSPSHTLVDAAAALSHVTDDLEQRLEADQWAQEQLLAGQSPEDLLTEMLSQGWDTADAEPIIENARKQTRGERGILTRDDVVREMNVDYRRATGGLSVAFRSGLFGLYGFTTGFMSAIRSVKKLRAMFRPPGNTKSSESTHH